MLQSQRQPPKLLEQVRTAIRTRHYSQIVVRDGKGQKDRVTKLLQPVKTPLQQHLQSVKQLHTRDLEAGHGAVYLPYALERMRGAINPNLMQHGAEDAFFECLWGRAMMPDRTQVLAQAE
jgi:hypothetical protein